MSKTKQSKKAQVVDGKVHITARVEQEGYDNCLALADKKEWSLSQVVNKLMKKAKLEDLQ